MQDVKVSVPQRIIETLTPGPILAQRRWFATYWCCARLDGGYHFIAAIGALFPDCESIQTTYDNELRDSSQDFRMV